MVEEVLMVSMSFQSRRTVTSAWLVLLRHTYSLESVEGYSRTSMHLWGDLETLVNIDRFPRYQECLRCAFAAVAPQPCSLELCRAMRDMTCSSPVYALSGCMVRISSHEALYAKEAPL